MLRLTRARRLRPPLPRRPHAADPRMAAALFLRHTFAATRRRETPGAARATPTPCGAPMTRPLYAQINLAALEGNLARVRACAPGAQMLAVVKANAYGHGLARVLPALADADGLALLELDAALALREARFSRRILLLEGFFEASELPEIAARRLATVVHDDAQVRMLETAHLPRPVEVFLKVNTGMNRLGVKPGEVAARGRAPVELRFRGGDPADDALRARRGRGRPEGAARGVRVGLPRPAVSAVARQLGRRHPLRRGRRRSRPAGHHAVRRDAVSLRHRRDDRRPAGDDAALRDSSPSRSSGPTTRSATAAATSRRARTGSASSPAATPTAIRATRRTARRCWSADARCASRAACRWT